MSTAIEGMPQITLPLFAPSSSAPQSSDPSTALGDLAGDALDFDILAEYLLDEGTSSAGGDALGLSAFDFNLDSAPQSGLVSPSEDGTPELGTAPAPKPDATVQQVQNIITAHAAAQQRAAPAPAPAAQPAAPAPAQARQTLAPAPPRPTHPAQPVLARAGMPMAPAPPVGAYSNLSVPAPIAAAPQVVLHQHAAVAAAAGGAKRRRMDAPIMAVTGAAAMMKNQFIPQMTAGRGRQKSQAQIDRRRERNRILARRTRLRKKFFFESLQKEVIDLQRENSALKEIAKVKLETEIAKKLLAGCKAMEQLPSSVIEACGDHTQTMDRQDVSLVKSIQGSQRSFIITDPSLQDNPIVYASDGFLSLTGYKREEVLGRNCRFLQGTETSADKVEQVRKAVANGEDVTVTMINYTSDGTAFWNKLFIAALRDAQNNIVNFIGVIVKVAAPDPGDAEAGKLLPGQQAGEVDSGNAEVTVKAIEGAVTKAVANAPGAPGPFLS